MDLGEQSCWRYHRLTLLFLLLILAGSLVGIIVPAGLGWDFSSFYDAGRRVAAGQIRDLYHPDSLIAGEEPQGHLGFWSVPASALLYVPLSYFPPTSALIIFKMQNTLAYFAALALLYLHNKKFVEDSSLARSKFAATFVFLSLLYQPFWAVYRVGGQSTPTVFLLLTLALLSHAHLRFFLSALLFVFAVMIKPTFVLALLFLLCVSGVEFMWSTIAIVSLAGLVSVLTLGWSVHREFLGVLLQGFLWSSPWFYNSSLYVSFENLKLLSDLAAHPAFSLVLLTLLPFTIKAIVGASFIAIMVKSRSQPWPHTARSHFDFLMAVSFCLLVAQTVWEHYLSFLFLLFAYVVASHRYFSRGALALVGAIFFLAIGQNLIFVDLLRSHFSFDSVPKLLFIGLYKSGPLILTLVFLWGHYQELFRSHATEAWPA